MQVLLDVPRLKMELPQSGANHNGRQAQYNRNVCRGTEKANAEKWNIKRQEKTGEANHGGEVGAEASPVLRVVVDQLFVSRLPNSEARGDGRAGLLFHEEMR